MSRPRWLAAPCLLGCLATAGEGASQTSATPGRARNIAARPGGGFSFDLPIWQPQHHGKPVGLVGAYNWGSKGARKTSAARVTNDRGEELWRLRFEDQPSSDEVARLELAYLFTLTDLEKSEIRQAAEKVAVDVLEAISAAAGSPETFEKRLAEKLGRALQSPAAKTLETYGDDSGNRNGLEILMERLGLSRADTSGWAIVDRERLGALARSVVEGRATAEALGRRIEQLRKTTVAAGDARCASVGDIATLKSEAADVILETCLPALLREAEAKAAQPAIRNDTALAGALREALAVLKRPPAAQSEWDLALSVLGRAGVTGYPFWAVRLASAVKGRQAAERAWTGVRDGLVADVTIAIERTVRTEIGSTLVSGADRPRRYDLSTGILYVHGLEDIIIPTLISICGWEGCLPPASAAWTASNGWWRAASFDAGIRVETIDTQNVRQSSQISFAIGVSYNPVSVLRLSAGAYAFEDGRTKSWNVTPYFGITVNILNAAEILGQLGLGELKPDVGAVKQ